MADTREVSLILNCTHEALEGWLHTYARASPYEVPIQGGAIWPNFDAGSADHWFKAVIG